MSDSRQTRVHDCDILELDRHHSLRKGNLSVVENGGSLPFDVRRVFYLYDVPAGSARGGHAHRSTHQVIVAVAGSFSLLLDDGIVKRTIVLNRPYMAIHVRPGIWNELYGFSSGAVVLVLASDRYDESEYIRKYKDFMSFKKG